MAHMFYNFNSFDNNCQAPNVLRVSCAVVESEMSFGSNLVFKIRTILLDA